MSCCATLSGLSPDPLLSSILSAPSPTVSEDQAAELVRAEYGLDATVRKLASERDQMFHLCDPGGAEYLLKITHPAEPLEVTHLQTAALAWIARADPALPVQRLHPARGGASELRIAIGGTAPRTIRLLSYLAGRPMHGTPASSAQRRALGAMLARLSRALAGFDHPVADYALAWDIAQAARLRPLLAHVQGNDRTALARSALDHFEADLLPRLAGLRRQVVHNDLNTHNVLVAPEASDRITGVIDFGDILRTQLVNDVAIGASYHVAAAADPLHGPSECIAAYHAATPLTEEEVALLPGLIATRLLVTVLITGWRAERDPANRDYILKHNRLAWDGLDSLSRIPGEVARQALRRACMTR